MKTLFNPILLYILLLPSIILCANYKPYIMGARTNLPVQETVQIVENSLTDNGFQVIGEYSPADDPARIVIVITTDELLDAVGKIGGLTGFAAALRVGITSAGSSSQISYVNPIYLGNAYFRENYPDVESNFRHISENLLNAMAQSGQLVNKEFGSEDGLSPKELKKYHYMFGMEYFDDVVKLNSFSNYEEAVRKIDSNLSSGVPNLKRVYSIEIPGKNLKLYGIGLSGDRGESHFLPIIDVSEPKHTAFLPYEILVDGKDIVMLHGRYRIALSFPDLTMMTFGKIMSTPGDIENLMESVTR